MAKKANGGSAVKTRTRTANDDIGNWCDGVTAYGDGDLGTPGAANPTCQ